MKHPDPERLVRYYEEGRITRVELVIRLVQAAASLPPERIAAVLPAEELRELREKTADPPQSPEDSPRIFRIVMWAGPHHDDEAEQRENQRLWFEGAREWHRFFNGGRAEQI